MVENAIKPVVAVFFGGQSVEHEVSIITGLQALNAVDRSKYDVIPVYISKSGFFYTGEDMDKVETYKDMKRCMEIAVRVIPERCENGRVNLIRRPGKRFGNNIAASFDVALPAVHGTNAEDGTLMGLLESLGVPYTGCDILSSAIGMDKYIMKTVLKQAGLPVLDAKLLSTREYAANPGAALDALEHEPGFPIIIKPVNLGSSVGISKAVDRAGLSEAVDTAFSYSPMVLAERAVENLREINCAVLGDRDGVQSSVCEEPVMSNEILNFDDKYLNGGKSAGMSGLKRRIPADLPEGMTEQVQKLAADTFISLGCSGVARIDFLNNTQSGELYVNEINTIPGSLAFYLWQASGINFSELLNRMISLAFKRHRERRALIFTYDTNILSGFGGTKGSKTGKL